MKHLILAAAIATASIPAIAQNNFSVSIGQPGFYGQIEIGDSQPRVYTREPVIVSNGPTSYFYSPVYLRVPPNHRNNWRRHCHKYNACNRKVYFVQDSWYNDVYVPQYREHNGGRDRSRRHYDRSYGIDDHDNNDHRNNGHRNNNRDNH